MQLFFFPNNYLHELLNWWLEDGEDDGRLVTVRNRREEGDEETQGFGLWVYEEGGRWWGHASDADAWGLKELRKKMKLREREEEEG